MPRYAQADVLKVQTPLGADALLLEKFRGREQLSAPFEFELDLLAEGETEIDFKKLLGQPATVSLQRPNGSKRYFNGVIRRFSEGEIVPGPCGEPTFTRYRAVLVPKLWLLSRNVQSRIFQQQSAPDILMKVLKDLEVSNRIQGRFQPRDYCAQYRESDLAFASRLMEDEGIYYYFEHSADGHRMVLANTPQAHPEVDSPAQVRYEHVAGGTRTDERVTGWLKSQEIRSGRSTLWDYCFEMPDKPLKASRPTASSSQVGTVEHSLQVAGNDQLELYDYPGSYAGRFDGIGPGGGDQSADLSKIFDDGTRTVGIRMQEEAAAAIRIDGEGGCRQFAAGAKFTLQGHRNGDGPYVLTSVEHEASLEGSYTTGSPAALLYHNRFQCLPFDLPFRPARTTPKPRVEGQQTAVVVGPSGDDPIFCDKYGRIKVQFRWDRQGKFDGDSSCWIRVAQPWAGANWGAITLPRIGQEVVVGFLEGDPDEPMILGSVYNAAQMPPFPLPDQKNQAGIKTRTVGSGASQPNFSGIRFEDTQGGEYVHIHSERDMAHSTERNLYLNVASEKHEHVGSFHSRQVGSVLPGVDHASWPSGPSASGGGGQEMDTDWQPTIGKSPAMNLDLTVGWHRNSTLGLYSWNLVGQISSTKINPLALISLIPGAVATDAFTPGIVGIGQVLSTAAQAANIDLVLGGNVAIQYGPKFEVRRGAPPLCATPNDNTVAGVIASVCALLYAGFNIGEIFLAAASPSLTGAEQWGELAGVWILNDLTLGAWIFIEASASVRQVQNATAGELRALSQQVFSLEDETAAVSDRLLLVEQVLGDHLEEYQRATAGRGSGAGATTDGSGCHTEAADVLYSLTAPNISLVSALELTDAGPSLITIQAVGNEEIDGAVLVYGSGMSVVQGGAEAWLRLQTAEEIGAITADCGEAGTLTLQSGAVQEPNCVTMSPEGITVSSTLMVTLESDESSVKVDPVGVTQTVAESSISVTAEGITLMVAESTIAITAEGITISCGPCAIEITPEGVVVTGPTVDVTGDAEVAITGAAITIT